MDSLTINRKLKSAMIDPEIQNTKNTFEIILHERKITPHTIELLKRMISTYEKALAKEEKDDEFLALKEDIQWSQKWIEKRVVKDEGYAEEIKMLQTLKQAQFKLRYGEYVKFCCKDFLTTSKRLPGRDTLAGRYWTEINNNIEEEEALMEDWKIGGRVGPRPHCPDISRLQEVAGCLLLPWKEVRDTITAYSDRNQIAHESGINQLVTQRNWHKIAEVLSQDRADLENILPPEMEEQKELYLKMLNQFENRIFKRLEVEKNEITGKVTVLRSTVLEVVEAEDERLYECKKKKEQELKNKEKEAKLKEER